MINDMLEAESVKPQQSNRDRFSLHKLKEITSDINSQPDWRSASNNACAYYDGDQLAPEVVAKLKERGQPLTTHNLIAPTVDGVLGMEAKTRTDLMVVADDPNEEFEQMAEAVNQAFSDACRLGSMNKARSDAYAEQIKAGLSWMEVRRNPDPFANKYIINTVSRNEVYWDWLSRQSDLSDCRWIMRKRWLDVDELKERFPDKSEMIDYSMNDWKGFVDTDLAEGQDSSLVSAWEEYNSWGRDHDEWLNRERKRAMLQVVYYRVYKRIPIIELQSGRVIEFDKNNIAHQVALSVGKVEVRMAHVSRIRESWFVGPHFLVDRDCTAPQGMFPLVPFWGYRKDKSGAPYGLVSRAIPAQDEVNFRRIKLTWLLQAKRIIKDADATNMTDRQLADEAERPDGIITLNPERQNKTTVSDALKIEQDFQVASQQFVVMQESMKLIQDGMGIYSAFLGQDSKATSGVAISNLVEQGATTLAEINDNYQFACQQVGMLLLSYLLEDLKRRKNYPVVVNQDDPRKRKTITLNEQVEPEGMSNDVSRLRAHIALAPIQQTPAYKSQLAQRLSEVIVGLPPEVQASVLDMWVELLDLPNKREFVERIRTAMNIPKSPDEMSDEEKQAAQQEQQQQAALQQQQMELAMRELEAKVAKYEAEVQRLAALAQKEAAFAEGQRYKDANVQAQTSKILQEIEVTGAEVNAELATLQSSLLQQIQEGIDQIPV